MRIAGEVKECGNRAFRAGDLDRALDKYQKGLRYLQEYRSARAKADGDDDDAPVDSDDEDLPEDDEELARREAERAQEPLPPASAEAASEFDRQAAVLRFSLHSNTALLQLKLRAFDDARRAAAAALAAADAAGASDTDRAKALFRRAAARSGLRDDEEAIKDLEAAAQLAPGDAAVARELAAAKHRLAEQIRKEKAAYKKFFA